MRKMKQKSTTTKWPRQVCFTSMSQVQVKMDYLPLSHVLNCETISNYLVYKNCKSKDAQED